MSVYVRWASPGLKRVSAQPVSNYWQREAIKFVTANGGVANRRDVLMHLIKGGAPVSEAKNVLTMISSFGFVVPLTREKLAASEWAENLIGRSDRKEENLIGLFVGIVSGGFARKQVNNMTGLLTGTRLILRTLMSVRERNAHDKVSLDNLCDEMSESGKVSVYCILQMLGQPSQSLSGAGDPYALGIVSLLGKSSPPSECFVKLNEDVLRSYQMSVMSRYMTKVIPKLIQEKYSLNLSEALSKRFDMLSSESLRKELQTLPPVWVDENDLDHLLYQVTLKLGFDWWAEDEQGGSRGLMGNQKYSYTKITREPVLFPLKNPYHALF